MNAQIKPGTYRHFKGKTYEVLGVAHHSETLEELVVYRALYTTKKYPYGSLWARPREMFAGMVVSIGRRLKRFRHLKAKT